MRTKQNIFSLFIFSALLYLCVFPAFGQKLWLRRYDVADGLANSKIMSIHQDKKGFIWISTHEGLSRFDGYGFVNYGVRDGLGQQIINSVAEDKQGRLWAATNGGGVSLLIDSQTPNAKELNVKANEKFISFRVSDNLYANLVNRIRFDSQNNLWCLTDFGFYRASLNDIANLKFEPVVEKLSGNSNALIEDSRGRIWFGLHNELFEFTGGQVINHGSSGEGGDFIRSIVETKDGKLLVATSIALYEFIPTEKNKRGRWSKQPLSLDGQQISLMFEDSSGGLWFSTNKGVIKYQNGRQFFYSKTEGIEYGIITFAEDREGNLWLGTNGGGVYKFGGDAFIGYAKNSAPMFASDVFENREGKTLAVLNDLSLVEITESGIRHMAKPDYAPSLSRYSFFKAANGEWIWNSGWYETKIKKPVIELRNGQKVSLNFFFTESDLSKGIHYYEDENSVLWLVKGNEVYRAADAEGRAFSNYTTLPIDNLLGGSRPQIMSDRVGGLWFSSGHGLCRLREKQFKCFQPSVGLPVIDPRSLFVDSRGWLWIGLRYDGVSVTKNPQDENPQFVNYKIELSSSVVWFIAEDNFGRMYYATERGLEQFDPKKNLWRNFNSKNGLSGDLIGPLTKDRQGNIWICTASGLTRFNPKAERITNKPPPIYLSRVNIAGDDLPMAETGANEIPLIELQSSRNNLAIEFVGLDFTGEDNLNYQYKLEGVDADWSAPTKQRFVNYARLSSGSYRFLVRAVNRERVASITHASFEFRILPPFYLRWWFIALCVLVVGSFAAAVYRYRVSQLLEMERMRTRIATDLHDDIGANLTRIALLSEVAKQENSNGKMLSSISDIARESVSSMNDIVWAIAPEHDRLLDLTRRMRQHAEEVFMFREIDLHFNAPQSERNLKLNVGARRDLLLIFKEAVNNAARHSDCSQVAIDFLVEHSVLRLQIKDNGKGIDKDLQAEGQGLRSMKRRAAALGGKLEIDSGPGEGATVQFEMPLRKSSELRL
jgi:signal transduction histidine kinase/ligand-binding sensor domain-containing protein